MSVTSPLPTGWTYAAVSDLCQFNPKTTADDDVACGFASMHGLGTKYRDRLRFEERPWGYVKKAYTHFQEGDVLIAKVTPCFENGKAGIASKLPNGIGAGSSEFCVFRPADGVDNRYLLAWFSNEEFRRRATVAMTGSVGLKRVPKEAFLSEQVPLAPAREQQRIADKLDTVLARVDAVNNRLARVAPLLKRFRQSVLAAATSGRLTAACSFEEWGESTVENLCRHIGDGPFGSNLKSDDYSSDGVRVVRLENIGHLNFVRDKQTFIPQEKYEQLIKHTLLPGDLLFSSFVDEEVRVCQFPGDLGVNAINKADCFCVRVDEALCDPKFLMMRLASRETYEALKDVVHGATRPRINLKQLRSLQLCLPSRPEQTEIVRRVDILFAFADRLEARLQAAQAAATRLTPSLLAKAFRGELVPQDPADEPAAELLRRLAKAQNSPAKKSKPRKAAVSAAS